MKSTHDLLARLRATASDLEPEMRGALEAEIAAHLDAAIQARLELGESPEEAEANAVAAFGDVGKVVEAIEEDLRPPRIAFSRPFLVSLAAFCVVFALTIKGAQGTAGVLLALALLACVTAGLVTSWRARCIQWRAFGWMAVPACLLGMAAMASMYITPYLGANAVARRNYDEQVAYYAKQARVQTAYVVNLEAAYARYQREGGLLSPRDYDGETGAIKYGRNRDAAMARRAWQSIPEAIESWRASAEGHRRWLAAAQQARGRSWIEEIPYQYAYGTGLGLEMLLFYFGVHLVGLFLRWFVDECGRTHRRWRRRRA